MTRKVWVNGPAEETTHHFLPGIDLVGFDLWDDTEVGLDCQSLKPEDRVVVL